MYDDLSATACERRVDEGALPSMLIEGEEVRGVEVDAEGTSRSSGLPRGVGHVSCSSSSSNTTTCAGGGEGALAFLEKN